MLELELVLDAIELGLAVLLGGIAFAAAVRYRDVRFGCIGGALLVVGLVGLLGLVESIASVGLPGGSPGATVLSLLIAAEVLLYLSLILARPPPAPTAGG